MTTLKSSYSMKCNSEVRGTSGEKCWDIDTLMNAVTASAAPGRALRGIWVSNVQGILLIGTVWVFHGIKGYKLQSNTRGDHSLCKTHSTIYRTTGTHTASEGVLVQVVWDVPASTASATPCSSSQSLHQKTLTSPGASSCPLSALLPSCPLFSPTVCCAGSKSEREIVHICLLTISPW